MSGENFYFGGFGQDAEPGSQEGGTQESGKKENAQDAAPNNFSGEKNPGSEAVPMTDSPDAAGRADCGTQDAARQDMDGREGNGEPEMERRNLHLPEAPRPDAGEKAGERQAGDGQGMYREGVNPRSGYYNAGADGQHSGYYGAGADGQQMYREPKKKESTAFGIASMILGILSLVCFCTCVNIPLAIVAIIFGIIQLVQHGSKKGMAIAGIITSAISVLLLGIFLAAFLLSADFKNGLWDNFGEEFFYSLPGDLDDGYDNYDDFDEFFDDGPDDGSGHHDDDHHDDTF